MFTNCLMMFSGWMVLAHAVGEEDNQDSSQVMVTETEKVGTNRTSLSDVSQSPEMWSITCKI